MCHRSGAWVLLVQSCGAGRAVPLDCGDPLCVDCERQRAKDRRDKWEPVLKGMRSPRMITLTIKSGAVLEERIRTLQGSFTRFLDLRLGPRNMGDLGDQGIKFVRSHYRDKLKKGDITGDVLANHLETWTGRIERFKGTINRHHGLKGKWPRMRDLIGEGFASLEITWSPGVGWHPHRHLAVDGQFIPWPVLCAAWIKATKGEGKIVDIKILDRNPKSILETIKYVTKSWEVPGDKRDEFRSAVRGLKRIWPLGGAKPSIPDKVCPYCHDPACGSHLVGLGQEVKRGKVGESEIMILQVEGDRHAFVLEIGTGWRSIPLYLINKEFACQIGSIRGP
jgi:hypothetical protein